MMVKCVLGERSTKYPITRGRTYEVDKIIHVHFSKNRFYHLVGQPEFVHWRTDRFEILLSE